MRFKRNLGMIVVILFAGLFAAFGAFWLLLRAFPNISEIFSNADALRALVAGVGPWGPLAYVAIQAMQVVLAPIPGEFTGMMAGALFGPTSGAVYATAGLALGSLLAFVLGRKFGRPLVERMVPPAHRAAFDRISSRRQLFIVFVVFVIPGFPKDSLTYLFSLGRVSFWGFFWISQIARLPGTLLLTFASSSAFTRDWATFAWVGAVSGLILVAAFVQRARIMAWLRTH
jgi:uncharacterized membrane protein YdjX (TVP38/TMEM64 family)